jgi:hypothetical protein
MAILPPTELALDSFGNPMSGKLVYADATPGTPNISPKTINGLLTLIPPPYAITLVIAYVSGCDVLIGNGPALDGSDEDNGATYLKERGSDSLSCSDRKPIYLIPVSGSGVVYFRFELRYSPED